MTTQVVQRKALLNSLTNCSKDMQKLVSNRNILSRNKLPLSAAELRKLLAAAKMEVVHDAPPPAVVNTTNG
jgi:hypothetical protein